ncbi:DNA internalization-related competence protein ComEC/Rec2 [Neisseria sp.]|uniref:DNA internalization-related competence protein ComEC/Rec2 n=1 Tax=Neisseria sp. TaxID=192066 RepID=UPI0035A00EA3
MRASDSRATGLPVAGVGYPNGKPMDVAVRAEDCTPPSESGEFVLTRRGLSLIIPAFIVSKGIVVVRALLPCWIAGVVLSFALPAVPPVWVWAVPLPCLFAAAFALLYRQGRTRPSENIQTALSVSRIGLRATVLLFCFLFGAAYGVWRTQNALAGQWPLGRDGVVRLDITVEGLPRTDEKRVQFEAQARDAAGRTFKLLLSDYQLRGWPAGSRWRVEARVRPVVGEVNLNGLNREAWALANGIGGTGTLGKERTRVSDGLPVGLTALRHRISADWQAADTGGQGFSDGIALMRALSVGEQSALRPELWAAFRPLGLTHLVSISGLHVGMVAVLFALLAKLAMRLMPFVPSKPRLWMTLAGLAAASAYALLAGFSVPTQRTVFMLAALGWAWYRGSGGGIWRGWWQALAAVLLFDPLAVLGAGFWLSFGLVAALIWAEQGRLRRDGSGWRTAVRAQWAATVWSAVLLGVLFAALPLASPLANAVMIPWFSWVLVPLALAASLLPFAPLQWLAAAAGEYTLRLVSAAAAVAPEYSVAAAPWPLAGLAAAAALIALLPRGLGLRPWAWLVLAGFVFYRPPPVPENQAHITVWDAGQGLSVGVQTASHYLLFDTGTEAAAQTGVVPSLRASGVRRIDTLVLSHHDTDHDGGFQTVARAATPVRILAGQPEFYPQAAFCKEQQWQWDGVVFEMLEPRRALHTENRSTAEDNDRSCILRVVAGGQSLLVTGDLGQAGERALVAKYGAGLFSQVLVLGHHGSNSSSSGGFLNAVSPQYGVASAGYGNAYRHPAADVQTRLKAHNIRLLRTDSSGALVFVLGGTGDVFAGRLKRTKPYWQKKPFE